MRILLHRAFGDLFQHRFRLAAFARLFDRDTALGLDILRIHAGSIDGLGLAGGDVHRKIAAQRIVAAGEIQQHADLAAVQVAGQFAGRGRVALETADADVLAQLHDQRLAGFLDAAGTIRDRHAGQRIEVGRIVLRHGLGRVLCERDEVIVLRDEVGFAVHFHQRAGLAVFRDERADHALRGHTAGRLARLGAALDAQLLFGRFQIAVGFDQRLFAFHHAETGHLAQFLDHTCSNFRHLLLRNK